MEQSQFNNNNNKRNIIDMSESKEEVSSMSESDVSTTLNTDEEKQLRALTQLVMDKLASKGETINTIYLILTTFYTSRKRST